MAGYYLYIFMAKIDVKFVCCVVGRRRLEFREVMGLLLRQDKRKTQLKLFR